MKRSEICASLLDVSTSDMTKCAYWWLDAASRAEWPEIIPKLVTRVRFPSLAFFKPLTSWDSYRPPSSWRAFLCPGGLSPTHFAASGRDVCDRAGDGAVSHLSLALPAVIVADHPYLGGAMKVEDLVPDDPWKEIELLLPTPHS